MNNPNSPDLLNAAKEKLTLRQLWDLAPFSATPPDRDGVVKVNPFREDRHPNFHVTENGRVFKDFARDNIKGGVWEFVQLCRPNWTNAEIVACLKERAGGIESPQAASRRRRQRAPLIARAVESPRPAVVGKLDPWPASVRARWEEGLHFLRNDPVRRHRIAEKRGWPVSVVDSLARLGLIAYPLLPWTNATRGTAFLVQAPKRGPLDTVSLLPLGYHQRWWKACEGKPAEKCWIFAPNEKPETDRAKWPLQFPPSKCPAAPFVLGDVANARLLVIIEGQWDAATFFHAAGWFDASSPARVAVFGMRGNQGTQPFFDYYSKLWPWKPAAWIIRDADKAGESWEPRRHVWDNGCGFADRLQAICSRVVVSKIKDPQRHGKDFNDYWRARKTSPAEIRRLLESLDLAGALTGNEVSA